jgi:hypothetical protein
MYAGHDGNVYKKDDNGDWSKWENGGWQPVNTQGTLSSPDKANGRRTSNGGTNDQGTLGGTNQPSANGQTNANNRTGQGKKAQNPQSQAASSEKRSKQTTPQKSNESVESGRTTAAGTKGGESSDVTSGLDREASARQRGSQNVNLQQKYQQKEGRRSQGSSSARPSRGSGQRAHRRD